MLLTSSCNGTLCATLVCRKEREIFPDYGFPQKLLQERKKENRRKQEPDDLAYREEQ